MGLYDQAIRFALQNFGELQEVFLIEWTRNVIDFYGPWLKSSERYFPDPIPQRHSYDTRNLCKFTEIQKIDAYLCCLPRFADLRRPHSWKPGRWCNSLTVFPPTTIPKDTDLAKYLSEPYEKWGSLDHPREYLESSFAKYWAELGRPSGKLPKFKPVHLLTDAEHQHIQRERRIGFRMLQTKFRINRHIQAMANFQNLPPEIRHEIYLLATPARVVHLKAEFVNVDECYTLWRVSSYQGAFCHWRQSKNYENRVRVYFYSNAPIPVLLHTCFESRDFLIKMGYQLAFKTKSHGPRTWFNYDRDVLFKDENTCDVAQFDPGDAIRYKEFTALEELLVVDWTRNAFPRGLTRDTGYPAKPPPKRHRYDTGNLWKCVKVEETSLLRTMYHCDPREESYYGPKIDKPRGYGPAPNIADWGTFGTRSAYL
ncbi:hypothetical protein FOC1_g10015062 [Fusarium oxysporum f. sp. cubense race 1]|uniref:2EXR domain-containing protein n=1 Tax=Fusarium oxysporum f. sp. cubense (strain race 1) TaxID=1229664 RepID=N4TFK1_FUSC1|nr:hypothetical protein FOC1_g10015062 [Fusarium oxysporum f. sp. cubense race 1]